MLLCTGAVMYVVVAAAQAPRVASARAACSLSYLLNRVPFCSVWLWQAIYDSATLCCHTAMVADNGRVRRRWHPACAQCPPIYLAWLAPDTRGARRARQFGLLPRPQTVSICYNSAINITILCM